MCVFILLVSVDVCGISHPILLLTGSHVLTRRVQWSLKFCPTTKLMPCIVIPTMSKHLIFFDHMSNFYKSTIFHSNGSKKHRKNETGGGSSDLEHAQLSARKQIGKSSGCRIRLWMSGKKACLGSGSMLEVTTDWIEPVGKHEKLLTLDFSATFAVDVASKD